MSYGVTGESGLAGRMVAGPRYSAQALRIPDNFGFTGTAHGGTVRQLWDRSQKFPYLVYGRIPTWEVEGQQVDPYYDVRGSGLGYMAVEDRPARAELRRLRPMARTYGDPRGAMLGEDSAPAAEVSSGLSDVFDFRRMVLPLVAGAVFLYLFRRR